MFWIGDNGMPPIAVINEFANEYTTARYFVEALEELGVPHRLYHPSEQQRIPKEFAIRLYIDDGTHYCIYPDPDVIKILYIIDTHTRIDLDLYLCRFADAVYCAQFNAVALVKPICRHASWLPLGCSTKWHRSENTPFLYDISFIGGVNDVKRGKYLNFLKERYAGRSFIGRADKSDIGKIYSGSRIAFNISSNNDINMRFFEVLCSGALLITERVHNNGMEQLLQGIDKPVCLFFDTLEEAAFLIDYYLEHEEEREAIAKRGRSFAESQTYVSRMKSILEDSTSVQSMNANMISYLSNCIMLTIRENGIKNTAKQYLGKLKRAFTND